MTTWRIRRIAVRALRVGIAAGLVCFAIAELAGPPDPHAWLQRLGASEAAAIVELVAAEKIARGRANGIVARDRAVRRRHRDRGLDRSKDATRADLRPVYRWMNERARIRAFERWPSRRV
jgi:hypothetical protein